MSESNLWGTSLTSHPDYVADQQLKDEEVRSIEEYEWERYYNQKRELHKARQLLVPLGWGPKPTWKPLSDAEKLALIRHCSDLSTLQLIEEVETSLREKNK